MRSFSEQIRGVLSDMAWPAVVALLATSCVIATLDLYARPASFAGPGLTLDEPFNIAQGVELAEGVTSLDLAACSQACAKLPDHPPLGRLWLGLHHNLLVACGWPLNAANWSLNAARIGSATAYGLIIFLIGTLASRWSGLKVGVFTALSIALMPRLFGHAHLAALETCMNLTYAAAALAIAEGWSRQAAPSWRAAALAGVLLGLALLTKIQGVLLIPVVVAWAICLWRGRAVWPLAVWGAATAAVFFIGWPWLWSEPVTHVAAYLGRTTNRGVVQTWYFGQQYVDRESPWHYAPVMFAVSVPVGLHLLGTAGAIAAIWKRNTPPAAERTPVSNFSRDLFLLAAALVPVLVFCLPGVAVYDGERLFSVSFPLWAVFVGRGAGLVDLEVTKRLKPIPGRCAVPLLLAMQLPGTFTSAPCQLSYYSLLTGGLRGASAAGLPVTYWGDSQTAAFLERVADRLPEGSTLQILPVMHRLQIPAMEQTWPTAMQKRIRLIPYNTERGRYVLFINRREYLPDESGKHPPSGQLLVEFRREGVLLAGLVELADAEPKSRSR